MLVLSDLLSRVEVPIDAKDAPRRGPEPAARSAPARQAYTGTKLRVS